MPHFVIPDTNSTNSLSFDHIVTVDLSSFTNAGDYLSLSLPEYQRTKIVQSESFIDFTSNEKGDFAAGPTDSIAFSQANPVIPNVNGDAEMRLPISLLTTVNKASISGVRFRIKAAEACNFRCLAIRACDEKWKLAPIDLDTLWHRVHRPPSTNGGTGLKTNYFTNPSGEVAKKISSDGAGWTGTREKETVGVPAFAGEWRDKYEMSSAGVQLAASTLTFAAAGTYIMSMYVWLNSEWNGGKLKIIFGSDFTKESETVLIEADTTKKGEWQRIATKVKVGSVDLLGTYELAYTSAPSTGAKSIVYTDAIMVELGETPTAYFDGRSPEAKWTGSVDNSTSTQTESLFPEEEKTRWPIAFRSNEVLGLTDPKPVNLTVGAAFRTGALTQTAGANKNEFALYFRDIPTDNQTMIEMNTKTMADLDVADKQPDFGRALFNARIQEEIDLYDQVELDERTQFNLERKPDESEHTWMEVKVKWGAETATNQLTILDADGVGYKWTGMSLDASASNNLDKGYYILIATIRDTWMRARIYKLNQVGEFSSETPVFDSGKITDDNLMKRRKGRFGWWASLRDGDAYVQNVKTRGTNFGEMISKEFRSITPVKGVQLYTGSTAEKELIEGFERTTPETMKLTLDPGASANGGAVRVDVTPLQSLQGIETNPFLIDDPANVRISFDIRFPSTEIPGGKLIAFLIGENETTYPIYLSNIKTDEWTHVKASLPEKLFQTGYYQMVLMQTLPVVATLWWIENLSAKTYTVKWSARSHRSDAWNIKGDRWLEAGFTLNTLHGGIAFPEHGNGLQVRAQALRQDAVISDFKAIPQYATLGRFAWTDNPENEHVILSETKLAGTGTTAGSSWGNPERITADDGSYTFTKEAPGEEESNLVTGNLFATNFGFNIPGSAIIKGIEIEIKHKAPWGGILKSSTIRDNTLKLMKLSSPVGENLVINTTEWNPPETAAVITYGGPQALASSTWTASEINNSGFGVAFKVTVGSFFSSGQVDYIKARVYYTF